MSDQHADGVRRYRKRPVVIDALRWTGSNIDAALAFMAPLDQLPNPQGYVNPGVGHTPALGTLDIPTLEGVMTASPGDFIIKGVKGEFYPCKPDIFDATYEMVLGPEDPAYPLHNDGSIGGTDE